MDKLQDGKAEARADRKATVTAAQDNDRYEDTAFGRRPIGARRRWVTALLTAVTAPFRPARREGRHTASNVDKDKR